MDSVLATHAHAARILKGCAACSPGFPALSIAG